jgi:hypothetical protein
MRRARPPAGPPPGPSTCCWAHGFASRRRRSRPATTPPAVGSPEGAHRRLGLRPPDEVPNPREATPNRKHGRRAATRQSWRFAGVSSRSGARSDSLKIVVSPVRVRVSPLDEVPANRPLRRSRRLRSCVAATRHKSPRSPKRTPQTRTPRASAPPVARTLTRARGLRDHRQMLVPRVEHMRCTGNETRVGLSPRYASTPRTAQGSARDDPFHTWARALRARSPRSDGSTTRRARG